MGILRLARLMWAVLVVTLLVTCSPMAHAQWEFVGGYQEYPYASYYNVSNYTFTDIDWHAEHNDGPYGYGGSATTSSGVTVWAGVSTTGASANGGGWIQSGSSAEYIYFPMFVWSGTGVGNPAHELTSASVSAVAEGTLLRPTDPFYGTGGGGMFGTGISILSSSFQYMDGWSFSYYDVDPFGYSPEFGLSIVSAGDYTSFSQNAVRLIVDSDTFASSEEEIYGPSDTYLSTVAIGLSYTTSY